MITRLWFLVPVVLAVIPAAEPVCHHASVGETRAVALEQVGRAQKDLQDRLAISWNKSLRITKDAPYDSGLPSCKGTGSLRLRTRLPKELVGRTIAFGPSERMPAGDIRVATSARRLLDLNADALADPRLIERLGVRCSPTIVHALSEVELELVENP